MTSRREILKAGLVASALPLAAGALAAPSARPEAVALYKILYDTRFPESVAFATRAAEHGHSVHAMHGDMTRFWYDDLYHRWRQGPAAIAGLTAHGALFCLERLAWDQRMRVVFRAEHTVAASGRVAHAVEGPAALVERASNTAVGRGWAEAMAEIAVLCPRRRTQRSSAYIETATAVPSPPVEKLYSWVIARVERA
jgi:hypothetical protein